ncbi:STM3941 family protein [Bacillus sp. MRMR6]|uniref:STM3941 family protein n=1 Tax=Bacillus sp. MRMR6 TaxID=1928617 RepID=UPI0009516440|nr:STM3941 family protein [Bacillus sp. MRMR6]OLS33423.1 hypothetical protein BTR25_25900 [Bacillus sp. MRMR6]
MNQGIVRVPMRKSLFILGLVVCLPLGVWGLYFSLFEDLSSEHMGGTKNIFSIILNFLPANIVLFCIAVISLLASYYLFKKLKEGKDAVIISPQGIIVNVAMSKTGLIPWRDIKDIEMIQSGRQKNLALILLDPDSFIRRQSLRVRFFLWLNKLTGDNYPILFSSTSVKMKLPELQRLIQDYHHRYKRAI